MALTYSDPLRLSGGEVLESRVSPRVSGISGLGVRM